MGFYVNPPNERKEDFLSKNGTRVSEGLRYCDVPAGELPVILVDNGPFTAAAIAYSEREFQEFMDPRDRRPKKIFLVPIKKLVDVSGPAFVTWARDNGHIPASPANA